MIGRLVLALTSVALIGLGVWLAAGPEYVALLP